MCCTSVTCWQDTAMERTLAILDHLLSLECLAAVFALLLFLNPCNATFAIAHAANVLLQLLKNCYISVHLNRNRRPQLTKEVNSVMSSQHKQQQQQQKCTGLQNYTSGINIRM